MWGISDQTVRQPFLFSSSLATLPASKHRGHLGLTQAPEDTKTGGFPPGLRWLSSRDGELGDWAGAASGGAGAGATMQGGDSPGRQWLPAGAHWS